MRTRQGVMKCDTPFSRGRLHHVLMLKETEAPNAEWKAALVKITLASILANQGKVIYEL